MKFGTAVVLAGVTGVAVVVLLRSRGVDLPAVAPIAAYVFASIGMGFAYPRTSVAMLAVTTDADRGFNSSALSVADSLGAALALSLSGIAYAVAVRSDVDPFPVVYAIRGRHRCARGAGGPAHGRSVGVVPAAEWTAVHEWHRTTDVPRREAPHKPLVGEHPPAPRVPRSAAAQCGVHERRRCVTAVGLVERRTGRHDLVDPVEHVGGQDDLLHAELRLELLQGARPDDGRRHRRVRKHEAEREVDQRQSGLVGELLQLVHGLELDPVLG